MSIAAAVPTQSYNKHQLRKGIVLTILIVFAFLAIVAYGAARLISNDPATNSTTDSQSNTGTSHSSGSPITNTDTPTYETPPSTSGSNANSLQQTE